MIITVSACNYVRACASLPSAAPVQGTRSEILSFLCDELYEWLLIGLKDDVGDKSVEEPRMERVNRRSFLELTEEDSRGMFPLIGERKRPNRYISLILVHGR